jgi:hypothetical protein
MGAGADGCIVWLHPLRPLTFAQSRRLLCLNAFLRPRTQRDVIESCTISRGADRTFQRGCYYHRFRGIRTVACLGTQPTTIRIFVINRFVYLSRL